MKTLNSFVALLIMLIFMSCADSTVSPTQNNVNIERVPKTKSGYTYISDEQLDNAFRRYATTITLQPSEEITIDGSTVGFFGWNFIELHSTDELELIFNFETVALQLTDFMVNGIRVENMSLINHGASPITINLIITGVR